MYCGPPKAAKKPLPVRGQGATLQNALTLTDKAKAFSASGWVAVALAQHVLFGLLRILGYFFAAERPLS